MYTTNVPRRTIQGITKHTNAVLISITDPHSAICGHPDFFFDILRISFMDYTKPFESFSFQDQKFLKDANAFPPTSEDASKIFNYIRQHNRQNIIVHCEAGISRSAAVAQFLVDNGWVLVHAYQGHHLLHANQLLLRLLREEQAKHGRP